MKESLLPVRHPNADFFIADIFDSIPVKSDRHTMEHPFFTLSTKKDIRSVEYEKDGVKIVLSPSAKYGLPTMMDKDILLYVGSLLMKEINEGRIPPKTVRFSARDLMVTTNRETNGKAYRLFKDALERITGCLISTNIKTNDIEESSNFHILEKSRIVKSSRNGSRMVELEATVSDWFYNALIGKEVLTINRDYFRLRKPLERRLYELARKHCGKQPEWKIMLELLKEKSGVQSPLNYFRFQLREITRTDHLPDYQISLDDRDVVTLSNRYHVVKQSLSTQGTLPGLEDIPSLHPKILRRGEQLVEKAGTGWNYETIRTQFTEQLVKGFKPRDVNAAFIGFVKKKVAQNA